MDGNGDLYVKKNKPSSERQVSHDFSHTQNLDLKNDRNIKVDWNFLRGMSWLGRRCI
jgi:hypothetical protein